VFLDEKPDVVLFEVGIGGKYDSTNIIPSADICVFTPIGLDHQEVLGETVAKIAEQKAGIIKEKSQVFTLASQHPDALAVLENYSVSNDIHLVPTDSLVSNQCESPNFMIENAYFAKRIANFYLNHKFHDLEIKKISLETLKDVKFPGRAHIVTRNNSTYFLDGAHTKQSIQKCVSWYRSIRKATKTVVIFYLTGNRDFKEFIGELETLENFELHFVPPLNRDSYQNENSNLTISDEAKIKRAKEMMDSYPGSKWYSDVEDCLENLQGEILVTGSIHLVGSVLKSLKENIIFE